jgi:6-pyruvoyltetrahydropterin/6-carboxytetrahydropterin synthase
VKNHGVVKSIDFCYGHRLLDYEGKCRHLHGHNGRLEVEVRAAQVDTRGMVIDFSDVRDAVKGWVDANLDHRMVLSERDPAVPALRGLGEPLYLMADNPTAENIAHLVFDHLRDAGIDVDEVRLWETPDSFASYRTA